jgi:exopolysaccharide production protein ExoZ
MQRRIERIVPMYWLTTITLVALSILFPSAFKNTDWLGGIQVLKSMLFITFLSGQFPVVYVGWSLEYEMFFYICVSLLLTRKELVWDELIIIFSVLAASRPIFANTSAYSQFFTNPLLLEFTLGVAAAKIFSGQRFSNVAAGALILSLASTAVGNYLDRAVLFGLPSAAVVLMAAFLSKTVKKQGAMTILCAKLGDASYSIYLLQVFFISGSCKLAARFAPAMSLDILIIAVTSITILAGYIAYEFLERPLLTFFRRFRTAPEKFGSPAIDS